ncbi:hypothetical protein GRAQ_03092 [Rahnella aquatilis CIP 78.65 = ATCC 33071]|nr:hypothetical protein GRAQ_03092 [Rahnella aquatilis CIP 78.65 = ATCC 33071]
MIVEISRSFKWANAIVEILLPESFEICKALHFPEPNQKKQRNFEFKMPRAIHKRI